MSKTASKYLIDLGLWGIVAPPVAFWLRLEGGVVDYGSALLIAVGLTLPLKAVAVQVCNFHRRSWHQGGVSDLLVLCSGVGFVSLIAVGGAFILRSWITIPLSVPLIEGLVAVGLLSAARVGARLWHRRQRQKGTEEPDRRALIVGAGDAGTMLVREIHAHPEFGIEPVGFLDDDPVKQKQKFRGLPVLGPLDDLKSVVREHDVDEVIFAIPSAPGSTVRKMVELAQGAGAQYRTVPSINDLVRKEISVSHVRDVHAEDLLRRDPISLEGEAVGDYVEGRTVLVTGAGGSIGSELVRQLTRYDPERLLLLGRGENSIFKVVKDLEETAPEHEYEPIIANVRDEDKITHLFEARKPDVVFHAAAHKHVPLMEKHPDEAVLNNVAGSRYLVEAALQTGVARFVNVSTDKAIRPTSVMGATKQLAERVVWWGDTQAGAAQQFNSVRFGNVLGSRGSVVPLFEKQIEDGGPVTITHPDMQRYFMTIPEAAQLVLQAGALGERGMTYVLDMGEPVKIERLARDLIRLSGFKPDEEIPVEYIGRRPGEKLSEELVAEGEILETSRHENISVALRNGQSDWPVFEQWLDALLRAASSHDIERVRELLDEMVAESQLTVPETPDQLGESL
jgi:FlaA1/EpsC-like NDP-sugar epimerase